MEHTRKDVIVDNIEATLSFHDGWDSLSSEDLRAIGENDWRASLDVTDMNVCFLRAEELRELADMLEAFEVECYIGELTE